MELVENWTETEAEKRSERCPTYQDQDHPLATGHQGQTGGCSGESPDNICTSISYLLKRDKTHLFVVRPSPSVLLHNTIIAGLGGGYSNSAWLLVISRSKQSSTNVVRRHRQKFLHSSVLCLIFHFTHYLPPVVKLSLSLMSHVLLSEGARGDL